MGVGDYWELIAAGADAAIVMILYNVYKNKVKEADDLKSTPLYQVGPELEKAISEADGNVLPYVCVEGVTRAIGKPLRSHYVADEMGVIQHIKMVEHKSKRSQGVWRDENRTIKDQLNTCTFSIGERDDEESQYFVRTTSTKSAAYLMTHLTETYNKFEANRAGWFSRFIDWCCGEKNKGIQETEKMLLVGVPFLGIGQVRVDGGMPIVEPASGDQSYILTTLSRAGVVKEMKGEAFAYKVGMIVLGVGGAGLIGYWVYRTFYEPKKESQ